MNAKLLLSSCILLAGMALGSCSSSEDVKTLSGAGNISLGVNTNAVFTRAVSMSEYEDVGNYTVQVIDDAGSTVKEFLYKDAPSEIKLKNGTYTLRAYYGEQTTASRDVFYVEGTKPFVVDADQQQVTVDCYPKCAQVVAAFSADMAEFFTDYSVVYETEALKAEGATAVWSKTDADPWFLKVNEKEENVKATITVTRKSDNKSATVVREYSMAPGKLWTLNISPNQNDGSLGIVIEVDETTNDQEIDIVVPSDWI